VDIRQGTKSKSTSTSTLLTTAPHLAEDCQIGQPNVRASADTLNADLRLSSASGVDGAREYQPLQPKSGAEGRAVKIAIVGHAAIIVERRKPDQRLWRRSIQTHKQLR